MRLHPHLRTLIGAASLAAPSLAAGQTAPTSVAGAPAADAPANVTKEKGESRHTGPRAIVSLPPLISLVQPLIDAAAGGDKPRPVTSLIPVGRSEHGYEIPPARLAELLEADLVVLIGLGLEPQVERFLAERAPTGVRRVVRLADVAGIDHGAADHDHEHGPDGECLHHGADPHLWLDPVLVERLVGSLEEALIASGRVDDGAAARVRAAGTALRERIRAVHERYALACGAFPSKLIVVGHDAWGRLAARYGLQTVAIAGLNATEPTPAALERARKAVEEHRLSAIFVEPQLSDRAGRRIASLTGVEVRRLDPLGSGDWFAMMESNLSELERVLGAKDRVKSTSEAGTGGSR